LIKSLTEGDKIIISTLQKFGYIGEVANLKGKHFAIIVDEAHSSQSGENVKDLKMSLTTDEALKDIIGQDEENSEPKDTVEAELEKIMASRQKLPHLSFFAFTATPKPKTLELFGIPDATNKHSCNLTGQCFEIGNKNIPPTVTTHFDQCKIRK